MATKKRYKKLTNAEKKSNKEFREKLRTKGIIPPVKPILNRKKFAKEVAEEFKEGFDPYDDIRYLFKAISWMRPALESRERISLEQVGVLKLLKIAIEIKKFGSDLKIKGETKYDVMDLYNVAVAPVLNL